MKKLHSTGPDLSAFGFGSNLSKAIDAAGDYWWLQPLFLFPSEITRSELFRGYSSALKHPC